MKEIKTITSEELNDIFKAYCLCHNYTYEEYRHDTILNHIILVYCKEEINNLGVSSIGRFGYHMCLDKNNRFIDAIRGLTKVLKGKQIIDMENVKKE